MRDRKIRRNYSSNAASRGMAPMPWSYFIVIALCGFLLAAGFFLAARQHFTSMDYGIKNSRLREQLKALESENRRLLLAREVSLSPDEIKKTARVLGFLEMEIPNAPMQANIAKRNTNQNVLKAADNGLSKDKLKLSSVKLTAQQTPVKPTDRDSAAKLNHPTSNPKRLMFQEIETLESKNDGNRSVKIGK